MLAKLLKHKLMLGIILVLILAGGYFGYKNFVKKETEPRYTLSAVEKGTIVVSVSGSGQVSASDQIDIKPKTSGDLIYVGVRNDQDVKAGTLIAQVDPTDAQKAVQEAQRSLEQAQLDLEKMQGIETALGKIRGVKEKAEDDLAQAYEEGFNTVTNVFLNLPTIMTGLQSILFDYTVGKVSQNIDYYRDSVYMYNSIASQYRTSTYNSYQTARTVYEKNFNDYKMTNRFSSSTEIESIINQTYETLKNIAAAVKDTVNLIQLYQDELTKHNITPNTTSTTHLSNLSSYTNTTNNYLSSLLSIKTTIEKNKENLIETDYDIADQEIQVAKMQDALDEANKNLSYCSIYAPFAGRITTVKVKKGDSVSSGSTIATLITKQKIAEISLNEVDAAKVKVGQKTTLTFDALPDVTITGKVIEIDTIGTVSQGVVSYGVKIALDTDDERIKPGMSVTADIIVDAKSDVLVLPNSAVKSQGGSSYVELVEASEEMKEKLLTSQLSTILPTQPKRQVVEIGVSNDTLTEIVSDLKEGDIVVVSEISQTKTQTTQTQRTQQFQIPGMGEQMRMR